jgi:hypothetical protein
MAGSLATAFGFQQDGPQGRGYSGHGFIHAEIGEKFFNCNFSHR